LLLIEIDVKNTKQKEFAYCAKTKTLTAKLKCQMYTVSHKNDIDVTHYNFDADQLIFIILA